MTDDLVQRLRRTYRKEYAPTRSMCGDNSNKPFPFPILATEVPVNPDGHEAADRIEALQAENFKLAAGSCDVEGGKVGDEHGHFYCTLQAKVEAQAAEIEWLREALRDIARDDFGLQGLIEDGVYAETGTSRYYAALVSWRRKRARAALEKQP